MGKTFQIFGHETIKNILDKQLNAGVFPHAYLFVGPQGVGKKALGIELAQKILGAENVAGHPDFLLLDVEGEIKMESALEFINRLSLKPFIGKYKVAIVNNAENLNQQSGNALLKTLEEASDSTIIILVAGFGKLLPTIVSRCQTFNFHGFSKTELTKYSGDLGLAVSDEMVDLSFGSFGRLKQLSENKEFFTNQKNAVKEYEELNKSMSGQKLAKIPRFAELEDEDLVSMLNCWLFWQYGKLNESPKNYSKVGAIASSLTDLKQNFNKKLVLQNLFLKI
ncbi:MAG: hypothetical protein WC794_00160 [Candidatus Doudnabacteria bacterium]|jgi:DNA polymerase-3 subunit delta'